MALEQFLNLGDSWDIPIENGPSPFLIIKESASLLDTGFRTRDERIEFTVELDGQRRKVTMIQFDFGPAFSETQELGSPVIYVQGELFTVRGARHLHIPVEGLFSVRDHNGGFKTVGKRRDRDFGYRFK